ncbi:tetratricopeptide repeat protein [Rosistilla oblonga]|uniref:tetratricopeptide repeat protein n=1 Tax=Rosistilla oblonga TaxID=2527990 RepID=UPI0018D25871|nr:tetratricopeptide repeat protein [Rosistilla oblonga]
MFVWRSSLDGVFHFDDFGNIVDNERILQLWPLDDFLTNNRPIGLYSFAINYHFSGTDPFAYHVTNLTIHIASGLFLMTGCLLAWRLYRKHWANDTQPQWTYSAILTAALISTVWAIHPLTTQAVTNVVQRYESLASMGYLGVWVGMLLYLDGRRWLGMVIVLPSAWIGLMSKEVFATAPLAVLLLDRLLTRQTWFSIARLRWLPYALMLSPYVWFVPSVSRFFDPERTRSSSMGLGMDRITPWEYLRTQAEVIWHYIGLVVWPKDLCFDYLWRIETSPWNYLPLGAAIVAVIVVAMVCYGRGIRQTANASARTFSIGLAGWMGLSFFFILAPTSSLMPIADIAVEHRMYLASATVIAAIVLSMQWLFTAGIRHSDHPLVLRAAAACIVVACISLLAWRTHLRNQDYCNGWVLWSTAARISPQNPRAWYNVGRELYTVGNYRGALPPLISAVGLSSVSVPMFDAGLADCLRRTGRFDDAVTLFRRAIEKDADNALYHNDLGVTYLQQEQYELAEQEFLVALGLQHAMAKFNLALVYQRQGKPAAAIRLWDQVLAEDPQLHSAARHLAWTLATTSVAGLTDVARAETLLRQHYDLSTTQSAYVLDTLAAIYARREQFDAAEKSVHAAIERARAVANRQLIPKLNQRLALYQNRKPCIDGVQP